jgi:hypothetical protein
MEAQEGECGEEAGDRPNTLGKHLPGISRALDLSCVERWRTVRGGWRPRKERAGCWNPFQVGTLLPRAGSTDLGANCSVVDRC